MQVYGTVQCYKHYEGWEGGVKFPGKMRYVTLEWTILDRSSAMICLPRLC